MPREICSVKYRDLDHAVQAYLKLCKSAKGASSYLKLSEEHENDDDDTVIVFSGKTDVQSAFRLIPLNPKSWRWLIMMVQNPQSGKWQFFINKCLPFGASISCAIFQRFLNALKFLTEKISHVDDVITNYLDDFLFLALTILGCNTLIRNFLNLCKEVGVPIAKEKTEWANE